MTQVEMDKAGKHTFHNEAGNAVLSEMYMCMSM